MFDDSMEVRMGITKCGDWDALNLHMSKTCREPVEVVIWMTWYCCNLKELLFLKDF